MAIILPKGLPAAERLRREGLQVLEGAGPCEPSLKVALVNLMPDRPSTETQFARLLGVTPYHVELTLVIPDGHDPKSTPPGHIAAFYRRWSEVAGRRFDGLIVTGAPVEHLPFEEVHYWAELCRIFDWARLHVGSAYYVCWAAQAALRHFHGVQKHALPHKAFGVFPQRASLRSVPLMRGMPETFPTPVSRHTEVRCAEIPWGNGLLPLAASPRSGLCLIEDRPRRAVCMFNHLEYDADTLLREYRRDRAAGLDIAPPEGCPDTADAEAAPGCAWRPAAEILFGNWLRQMAARNARNVDNTVSPLRALQRIGAAHPCPVGFGF